MLSTDPVQGRYKWRLFCQGAQKKKSPFVHKHIHDINNYHFIQKIVHIILDSFCFVCSFEFKRLMMNPGSWTSNHPGLYLRGQERYYLLNRSGTYRLLTSMSSQPDKMIWIREIHFKIKLNIHDCYIKLMYNTARIEEKKNTKQNVPLFIIQFLLLNNRHTT